MRKKVFRALFFYSMPLLVFFTIWIPQIEQYYVPNTDITDDMVEKARRIPEDAVFQELKEFSFGLNPLWKNDRELITAAEKMMRGELEITKKFAARFDVPFNPNDLDSGLPTSQLSLAAFVVPKVLTDAYHLTNEERFLMTARDIILGWAAYERTAWFPKGLLWDHHAISARVTVLAEFWRVYRTHPRYDPQTAKAILQMVSRSAKLLAGPKRFRFSTNQGIMQNLALWHLCIAFPDLPDVERYKRLALSRMKDQMAFYMSEEGVILEHSAGYHREGMQLISAALKYLTLMNEPIPDDWKKKYEKGKEFYAQLRRPDGSLPMFGDTVSLQDPYGPRVRGLETDGVGPVLDDKIGGIVKKPNSLYPISGYAIWWDGLEKWPDLSQLNQTVAAWSYFPGHGHKHADEMSLLLWAGGQTWWTNVGYWPYGAKGRAEADSWTGSNAPHLTNEPEESARSTRLRSSGWTDDFAVVDLEREGPGAYRARRQVVHWKPDLWVVVDSTLGRKGDRTTTTWTTSHDVILSEGKSPGSYDLKAQNSRLGLKAFLIASKGAEIKMLKGSFDPFAGWEVVDYFNEPAPALVVEQPADDSWAAAVWSLEPAADARISFTRTPTMETWESPEHWNIILPTVSGPIQIGRNGEKIHLDGRGRPSNEVALLPAPEVKEKRAEILAAYDLAASRYRESPDLFDYRIKVTKYLIVLFLAQEGLFFVYQRLIKKYYFGLRLLNILGWAGVGMWLVYFRLGF